MKRLFKYNWLLVTALAVLGCEPFEEEKPGLGDSPDASQMIVDVDNSDPYNPVFSYSPDFEYHKIIWDLGRGVVVEDQEEVTDYFGFESNYEIKITVLTQGGQATKVLNHVVSETDPAICENEIYNLLTGGCDAVEGKTWVWASHQPSHFGVGPADGITGPIWYAAGAYDQEGNGLYDDEMTFTLDAQYSFALNNNGDTFVNVGELGGFPGKDGNEYDSDPTLPYTPPTEVSWAVERGEGENQGKTYLKLSNGGFLSYWESSDTYEILSISEDELYVMGAGSGNGWYYRFVPKSSVKERAEGTINITPEADANTFSFSADVIANDAVVQGEYRWDFGNGESAEGNIVTATYQAKGEYTVTLTIPTDLGDVSVTANVTIEENHPDYIPSVEMVFQDFDGTDIVPFSLEDDSGLGSLTKVANPDQSSPNYSAMVGEYVKDENSGQYTNAFAVLPSKLNMTEVSTFKMQVRGKKGTKVELKLQNTAMGGDMWATQAVVAYEIQEDDTWEEAEFDFTNAVVWTWGPNEPSDASNIKDYDKIVIQFGGEDVAPNNNPGTYYFDNLRGPSF
ncbi:PKD domain-containing protein [Xanthovirga aplysinae]|uniref:PKD domain-containing protein n=1 Tax=Xanthovirga aplysinae TaxID=2529853 RepID=UPI00165759F7|nr:PKD domain-containing protein [Xanthovirga aplysinae]